MDKDPKERKRKEKLAFQGPFFRSPAFLWILWIGLALLMWGVLALINLLT